jgi:hypothetical protein
MVLELYHELQVEDVIAHQVLHHPRVTLMAYVVVIKNIVMLKRSKGNNIKLTNLTNMIHSFLPFLLFDSFIGAVTVANVRHCNQ